MSMYHNYTDNKIPSCGSESFKLMGFEKAINLPIIYPLDDSDHEMSATEIIALCNFVLKNKHTTVWEVGTYKGRTTINLAHMLVLLRNGGIPVNAVHTIDINDFRGNGSYFEDDYVRDLLPYIDFHKGDSGHFDFSPWCDGSVGLVFIDGSHAYDHVMADSKQAYKMMAAGPGLKQIVWHDFHACWPSVIRATWDFVHSPEINTGNKNVFRMKNTNFLVMEWCNK